VAQQPDGMSDGHGSFILQRSAQIVALEAELSAGTGGSCTAGEASIPGLLSAACKPLVCLWSARAQVNVDLWLHAFTPLPESAFNDRCPLPTGGQRGALIKPGTLVEVNLLVGRTRNERQPFHFTGVCAR
jgi:hypothetical protein